MKNMLLIAFATLALSLGANALNACPNCEARENAAMAEKAKAEKAEVQKAEKAESKVVADAKVEKTTEKAVVVVKTAGSSATYTKASAGQMVKADRDCSGACSKAAAGQSTASDGGCCGGNEGCCGGNKDCCGGCDKAEKTDCGGCKTAEKTVKN